MKKILVYLSVLAATACSTHEKEDIQGTWEGIAVLEDETPMAIDPSEIRISFGDKNNYAYSSTLNYKEAGTYYLDGKYLYTTDTLNMASTEKAVEIVKLVEDSLVLKMNDGGRSRILQLKKVK